MMRLTLGMTGMDSATEAALKAAVEEANARLGLVWQLLPEADASHVVIDMDSMYGPMSWLRMHAAGKRVIGLTAAKRTQTDFHLPRPFDTDSVATLLEAVRSDALAADARDAIPEPGEQVAADAEIDSPASPTDDVTATDAADAADPGTADPDPVAGTVAETAPQRIETSETGSSVTAPTDPVPTGTAPAEADATEPDEGIPRDSNADEIAVEAEDPGHEQLPPAPPPERRLLDWLASGTLRGRVRYQPASDAQPLLIDADKQHYLGPEVLKPLAAHFADVIEADSFETLDDDAWEADRASLGPAQPLVRLQWYGGLLAGQGQLQAGYDPDGRYKLGKWPQTEREFPKHFRIAAAMMKGPATLEEIATASGVEATEVADFVNANLASGYAEFVPEAPPEPPPAPKSTGLFGRLRGR